MDNYETVLAKHKEEEAEVRREGKKKASCETSSGLIYINGICQINITEDLLNNIATVASQRDSSGRYSTNFERAKQTAKALLEAINKYGIKDKNYIAYILATTQYETNFGGKMDEWADGSDYDISVNPAMAYELGNTNVGDGTRYKGRGFVQITGRGNYQEHTDRLGIDLISNPEIVQYDDSIAADIAVYGMLNGTFRGDSLPAFYGSDGIYNFSGARNIINGDFWNGDTVATIAKKYRDALGIFNF